MTPRIQHRDAAALAAGYSRSHRALEITGIVAFAICATILVVRIAHHIGGHLWFLPAGLLVGLIGADFFSGFVHWFCDTWGTVETPLIGKLFIRTFREHHVDQESITRHDFIETNGDAFLVSSPLLALALLLPMAEPTSLFVGSFVLGLTFFVSMTSQIHQWAHMRRPPTAIHWLQRAHFILPQEHHAKHHSAPFDRYYCITVGWFNEPLRRMGFFGMLERTITALTGALPRQDDIGVAAALAVAEENGVLPDPAGADVDALEPAEKPSVSLSGR